jgi:hypothetical protein
MLILAGVFALTACAGLSSRDAEKNLQSWRGQTGNALTNAFGYPAKTVDLQGGQKVYEYVFSDKCTIDFNVNSSNLVSELKIQADDARNCPHKLPGGGTY